MPDSCSVTGPDPQRDHRWGPLWAYIWLVYLVFPLVTLAHSPFGTAQRLIGVGGLGVFVALYVWAWWPPLDRMWTRAPLAAVVTLALAVWFTVWMGADWYGLFLYAGTLGAQAASQRGAILAAIAATAACVGSLLWIHESAITILSLGFTCALVSCAQVGLRHLLRTTAALRAANEQVARLAAIEERLRIARDVHDLLGHSLSVIALKADLAGRLLGAGDTARAAAEIAEVQAVARRSLTEVREAVAGYRRLRLDEELGRVREALEAAGIRCAFARPPGELPETVDATLAWVVREAATNIVRHSRARICQIRIERRPDRVEAVIEDDGRGPSAGLAAGSGLAGLGERVRAAGGELDTGQASLGGFLVRAWVPLADGGGTAVEARTGARR